MPLLLGTGRALLARNAVTVIPITSPTASDASSTTSTTATFPLAFPATGPLWTLITPQFDTNGLGTWVDQQTVAVSVAQGASQNVVVYGIPANTAYSGRFRFKLSNGGVDSPVTSNAVSATTIASSGTNRAQLYMGANARNYYPPNQKSTTLPGAVTQKSTASLKHQLQGATASSTQFANVTMNNNSSPQVAYWGQFQSNPLIAQTIPAGTYTFKMGLTCDTASTTYSLAPCLYIYRPTTDTVVGYINDSATGLTVGSPPTSDATGGRVFTVSLGSGIVCQDGDVLILEHFAIGARTTGTTVSPQSQYGNSTAITEGGSSHSPAAGVFFPSNIQFNESP